MSFFTRNAAIPHDGFGPPSIPTPSSAVDPFERYNVPNQYKPMNPYSQMTSTHYNAPQAYGLTAYELGVFIYGQIRKKAEDVWYTRDALPITEITTNKVSYSSIIFENALAELTPYEGVPRIISTSMRSDQKSLQRRAIALLSEESYRATPGGKAMYTMSLKHLATIVTDTQNYDVLMAYFNCKRYDLEWERDNSSYSRRTIADIFKRDVDSFAAIQKFGFAKLDAMITAIHTMYGAEGLDGWILPREVRVFLGLVPEEHTVHFKGGDKAVDQLQDGIGKIYDDSAVPLIFGNVYKVYFTRTYSIGENGGILNPMLRQRTIGEYFPQVAQTNQSGYKYKSNHRIIRVYDEDTDDYAIIGLDASLDAIKYMFNTTAQNPGSSKDSDYGKVREITDLVQTRYYDVLNFKKDILQNFMYRSDAKDGQLPEPIDLIGEIRKEHFSTQSLHDMAMSVVRAIANPSNCNESCDELYSDFQAGIELMEKYSNYSVEPWLETLPQRFDKDYYPYIQKSDDRHFSSSEVQILPFDNRIGASITKKMMFSTSNFNLSSKLESSDLVKQLKKQLTAQDFIPYMTNWPGLLYISEKKILDASPISDDVKKIITKFVKSVKKITSELKNIAIDSHLLDKKYTLPYFPVQSEEAVLLRAIEDINGTDRYPVWVSQSFSDAELEDHENYDDHITDEQKEKQIKTALEIAYDRMESGVGYVSTITKMISVLDSVFEAYVPVAKKIVVGNDFTFIKKGASIQGSIATTAKAGIGEEDIKYASLLLAFLLVPLFIVKSTEADPEKDGSNSVLIREYIYTNRQSTTFMLMNDGNIYVSDSTKLYLDTLCEALSRLPDMLRDNDNANVARDIVERFLDSISADVTSGERNKTIIINLLKILMDNDLFAQAEDYISKVEAAKSYVYSTPTVSVGAKQSTSLFSENLKKDTVINPLRTTFTLSHEQLTHYLKYVYDTQHASHLEKSHMMPFPITVSLPETGYNKPATYKEILDHLTTKNTNFNIDKIFTNIKPTQTKIKNTGHHEQFNDILHQIFLGPGTSPPTFPAADLSPVTSVSRVNFLHKTADIIEDFEPHTTIVLFSTLLNSTKQRPEFFARFNNVFDETKPQKYKKMLYSIFDSPSTAKQIKTLKVLKKPKKTGNKRKDPDTFEYYTKFFSVARAVAENDEFADGLKDKVFTKYIVPMIAKKTGATNALAALAAAINAGGGIPTAGQAQDQNDLTLVATDVTTKLQIADVMLAAFDFSHDKIKDLLAAITTYLAGLNTDVETGYSAMVAGGNAVVLLNNYNAIMTTFANIGQDLVDHKDTLINIAKLVSSDLFKQDREKLKKNIDTANIVLELLEEFVEFILYNSNFIVNELTKILSTLSGFQSFYLVDATTKAARDTQTDNKKGIIKVIIEKLENQDFKILLNLKTQIGTFRNELSSRISTKFTVPVSQKRKLVHQASYITKKPAFDKYLSGAVYENIIPSYLIPKEYKNVSELIKIHKHIIMNNIDTFGGNPILESNYDLISNKQSHILDGLIAKVLIFTPFRFDILRQFITKDVILPIGFLHMRPFMRYNTMAGIKTRFGRDTGSTFVNPQQENTMEGSSVETKTYLRHFSYMSASIITNHRLVYVAYDIFCYRCLGGAGTAFYDIDDLKTFSLNEQRYSTDKSIIVAPLPYEERDFPNPLDASGKFSYYSIQGFQNGKLADLHYSTAALMNALFGFRGASEGSNQDIEIWNYHPRSNGEHTPNTTPKNTCMFRGHYGYFDSRMNEFIYRSGTGHMKNFSAPGAKEGRNGGFVNWGSLPGQNTTTKM